MMSIAGRRLCADKQFKQDGFTLLELLVVLVVVTLMIGFATLQLGSGGRENEVRWSVSHFAETLALALDEAQFNSRNRGLALWRENLDAPWQFNWFELTDGEWRPLQEKHDTVFAAGALSARFEMELLVENEAVLLPEDVNPAEPVNAPQIYFFSGGEITPFQLTLRMANDDSQSYQINGDLLGRVTLVENGDEQA